MRNQRYGNGINLKQGVLTQAEKEHIVREMREAPHKLDSWVWAVQFGRLPATIRKIAAEAGVELLNGR